MDELQKFSRKELKYISIPLFAGDACLYINYLKCPITEKEMAKIKAVFRETITLLEENYLEKERGT